MWSDNDGFIEELISPVTKDTEFGVKHLTDSVAATAEVHVYSISMITPSNLNERCHGIRSNLISLLLLLNF